MTPCRKNLLFALPSYLSPKTERNHAILIRNGGSPTFLLSNSEMGHLEDPRRVKTEHCVNKEGGQGIGDDEIEKMIKIQVDTSCSNGSPVLSIHPYSFASCFVPLDCWKLIVHLAESSKCVYAKVILSKWSTAIYALLCWMFLRIKDDVNNDKNDQEVFQGRQARLGRWARQHLRKKVRPPTSNCILQDLIKHLSAFSQCTG